MRKRNLSKSIRPRYITALISGAICGVVLAGCGTPESAEESDAEGSDSSESTQGVTDDTIKIGVFSSFSGETAVFSKAAEMAIAVYERQNEQGGINGRQIEVVTADSVCDEASTQTLLRRFIEEDQVFMVHGGSCSAVVVANKAIIEQSGIPFLSLNATSAEISNPPLENLFHPKPTPDEKGSAITDFITSVPDVQRVGLVAGPDELSQALLTSTIAALDEAGIEHVDVELANEAGDATAQVQQLLAADVDVVAPTVQPQAMTSLLRDAHEQGLDVPMVTSDIARPDEQVDRLGASEPVEEFFSEYLFLEPVNSPAYEEYVGLFEGANPQLEFDGFALEGVTTAQMTIQALEAMGDDLTWGNWIDTMGTLEFETDTSGTVSFSEFAEGDPLSRRAQLSQRWLVMDLCSDMAEMLVVEDWAAYEEAGTC